MLIYLSLTLKKKSFLIHQYEFDINNLSLY